MPLSVRIDCSRIDAADPLNSLSAHIAKQIENGAPVFINQPVANKES